MFSPSLIIDFIIIAPNKHIANINDDNAVKGVRKYNTHKITIIQKDIIHDMQKLNAFINVTSSHLGFCPSLLFIFSLNSHLNSMTHNKL